MKKNLLLFCVLPCLLNAQSVSRDVMNEKAFFKQLLEKQQADLISLSSDAHENLPDTIYTYLGEERLLESIEKMIYEENGNKQQIKGLKDLNGDGIISADEMTKVDYSYKLKNDTLEIQEIYAVLHDDWVDVSKTVSIQKSPDIQLEYSIYTKRDDAWSLVIKLIAVEFNEKGLPVLYNIYNSDMTVGGDISFYMCREITYDEKNRYSTFTDFFPDAFPAAKIKFNYNENEKLEKVIRYDYKLENEDLFFDYMVEYTYDDKGNLSSKIKKNESGIEEAIYYTNIYPSTVSIDPVFSVHSIVYPNPVSDVLNVTIDGAEQAVITIINASGSIVSQQKTQQSTTSIPVNTLAKGYYFLTVQTAKGTKTHKVIIK